MPRRPPYPITDPRQIAALGSPARQEVVDGLQALGPSSIAELGASLGRAPDSLYYHVRALEKVGLVVRAGTRTAGPRPEALYDVPGKLALDHEPGSRRERDSLARLVASALRIGERDFRRALAEGRARHRRGPQRNAWGGRMKGWLTPEELAEARTHLAALSELFARGQRRRGAELAAFSFVLAPLAPSARVRPAPRTRKSTTP
jgi:predicted ArsR family transcriptional regulator